MRFAAFAGVISAVSAASPAHAFEIEMLEPIVVANIDKTTQQMEVFVNGEHYYTWKVSTGLGRYSTPTGENFIPYRMHKMWYSRIYNRAPMPYAVFYDGGYAVHGTNAIWRLGAPASHGCTRLRTENAKILYQLVRKYGRHRTHINIAGAWQGKPGKSRRGKRFARYHAAR